MQWKSRQHIPWAIALALSWILFVAIHADAQKSTKTQPPQPPISGSFREVLVKSIGKSTNLGILKKVESDHLVLEDENTTIMVPVSCVHSLKFVREEESPEAKLEIRLVARE